MPPEDQAEGSRETELERVEKTEDFVEKYVEEFVVAEGENHIIIDFQNPDAHIMLGENGEPARFGGELKSEIRLRIPERIAAGLADSLSEYDVDDVEGGGNNGEETKENSRE